MPKKISHADEIHAELARKFAKGELTEADYLAMQRQLIEITQLPEAPVCKKP